MKRDKDWLRQAKHNMKHSESSLEWGHYDWACFAAHQAAEMAIKALFQSKGAEAWAFASKITSELTIWDRTTRRYLKGSSKSRSSVYPFTISKWTLCWFAK